MLNMDKLAKIAKALTALSTRLDAALAEQRKQVRRKAAIQAVKTRRLMAQIKALREAGKPKIERRPLPTIKPKIERRPLPPQV